MKLKNSLTGLLVIFTLTAKGQLKDYAYQQSIATPTEMWHRIDLPTTVFKTVNNSYSDIRIYGITANKDTIEVPYLLRQYEEKVTKKSVEFTLLNQSRNKAGSFFTFELPVDGGLNQIMLNFSNANYDWHVTLEGSQDMKEWFTLLEEYRILAINNPTTHFTFSTLNFPEAKFRYFRIKIPGNEVPVLRSASLTHNTIEPGQQVSYPLFFTVTENKKEKNTTVEIDLGSRVPVNNIRLKIADDIDFYRPYTLQYLSDSFKTERGWQYTYSEIGNGVLNSLENNHLKIENVLAEKFQIAIENQDNAPLTIDSVFVWGAKHALIARFTEKADYFLAYGNKHAQLPAYDIGHFAEAIPAELTLLEVGDAEPILIGPLDEYEPSSPSQYWLWLTLVVVAGGLGWFAVKLLKKEG